MTQLGGLCRSVARSAKAAAARTRLAQTQAPGTDGRLSAAFASADPQAIASVPLRRQLAEHLAAAQRGRARSRPPHPTLLEAAAIPRLAALHRIQPGAHIAAAFAPPEPHLSAAVLNRDKFAEPAASDIAARREGPCRRQRGRDARVHERSMGFGILHSSITAFDSRARGWAKMGIERSCRVDVGLHRYGTRVRIMAPRV